MLEIVLMKELSLGGRDHIDLCDLLKVTDLCQTGGEAKNVIGNGEVLVDGIVETRKRCKIRAGQMVEYKTIRVEVKA
jgi:ribosome-associated protein